MTIRPLLVVGGLLLALGFSAATQAKPRRDAGCYDRCDRGLLSCPTDTQSCMRDRGSCIRSCDPDPAHPSARTLQRLQETDAQLHQRLLAKPKGKLTICELRCEDATEACGRVNRAPVCSSGREACFQRCNAPGKPG